MTDDSRNTLSQTTEHAGSRSSAPILIAGFPSPSLLLRLRGLWDDLLAVEFERFFASEIPERLREAGADAIRLPFFSGLGLTAEADDTRRFVEVAARVREAGLRVHWYVSLGTLCLETMLLEEPDARHWVQHNAQGVPVRPPEAGDVFFTRPCPNSESWRRFMEKVLTRLLDLTPDGIHFTACGWNAEPDTCRCPVCTASFREFVRGRGRSEEIPFGFSPLTHLRPPSYANQADALNAETHPFASRVPHTSEWRRFKTAAWAELLNGFIRLVHRRLPHCFIGADVLPPHPFPRRAAPSGPDALAAVRFGLSPDELWPILDAVEWLTGSTPPPPFWQAAESSSREHRDEAESTSLSQARTLKALASQQVVAPLCRFLLADDRAGGSAGETALRAGIQAAFGGRCLGMVSAAHLLSAQGETAATLRAAAHFLCDLTAEDQNNATPVNLIGVLRDWENPADTAEAACLPPQVETELAVRNFAFTPLAATQVRRYSEFRVLVLPEIVRLSDEGAYALRSYVERGGGLVLMGACGVRNEDGRTRAVGVWRDWLEGVDTAVPANLSRGAGRFSVVPLRGVPGSAAETRFNPDDLEAAVRFAAGEAGFPWEVRTTEGRFLAEVQTRETTKNDAEKKRGLLIHLLPLTTDQPLRGLEIRLKIADFPFLDGTLEAVLTAPEKESVSIGVTRENELLVIRADEIHGCGIFKLNAN